MDFSLASSKLKISVLAVCSLMFSFYLWGQNLGAQWGIIDDHEIMRFTGPSGRLKIADFGRVLLDTEFGSPGTSLRYRPSYYLIRISEAFLWGNSPLAWYSCRLILFAIVFSILWWLTAKYAGLLVGLMLTLYVSVFPYWADIWTRLGPAETYAVVGTAIYALGFVNIWELAQRGAKEDRFSSTNWVLMLLGAFAAMGSKENFLLLLAPSFLLLIALWRKQLLGKAAVAASVLIGSYGVFITSAVCVALLKSKKDIYANSVEPTGRLELLYLGVKNALSGRYVISGAIILASLIGALFVYLLKHSDCDRVRQLSRYVARYLCQSGVLLFLYASQFAFYSGKWPTGIRYDFPGALCAPLLMLFTALLVRDALAVFSSETVWRNAVPVIFSVILGGLILQQGFEPLRTASRRNAEKTRMFTAGIADVTKTLLNEPSTNLLFVSANALADFEPLYSVSLFLRNNNVKNNFYLYLTAPPQGSSKGNLREDLAYQLRAVSAQGSKGNWEHTDFLPLGGMDPRRNCFSLSFSTSSPAVPACVDLGRVM
jgi:hypothetical protein